MSSTTAYFAPPDVYELMYADIVADIAPFAAAAVAAGGPVLEVCCGNGRLLIPALEAGAECDGLDSDPLMVADLDRRLAAKGLRAGTFVGDMRDFTLPRRYALIAIGFNSFLHNLTQDDQLATLRACRAHLAPGGCLQVVAFHPDTTKLLSFDGSRYLLKEIPNPREPGTVRIWDATTSDRYAQINTVHRTLEVHDLSGAITAHHEGTFQLRYIWAPELELLLRVAGFARWQAAPLLSATREPIHAEDGRLPREGETMLWSAWSA